MTGDNRGERRIQFPKTPRQGGGAAGGSIHGALERARQHLRGDNIRSVSVSWAIRNAGPHGDLGGSRFTRTSRKASRVVGRNGRDRGGVCLCKTGEERAAQDSRVSAVASVRAGPDSWHRRSKRERPYRRIWAHHVTEVMPVTVREGVASRVVGPIAPAVAEENLKRVERASGVEPIGVGQHFGPKGRAAKRTGYDAGGVEDCARGRRDRDRQRVSPRLRCRLQRAAPRRLSWDGTH
jgi:hypothetical protein